MRLSTLSSVLLGAVAASGADSALEQQVVTLFHEQKWSEAQAVLEQAVAARPDDAEAQYYLGVSFLNRNDGEHAVPPLERATALAPANSEYFRHLGDACGLAAQKAGFFAQIGWARKCKAAYDKAVALDPKNLNARRALMEYCRLAPAIIGGGMDRAYAQAAEIRMIDPARGRLAYASLYIADRKYPEALAMFADVLKDAPDDYDALYQFGRFAAMSGLELDRGLASLQRCLALIPPSGSPGPGSTNWRIGNILEKKGDKAGARTAYETALKTEPDLKQAAEALRKLNSGG